MIFQNDNNAACNFEIQLMNFQMQTDFNYIAQKSNDLS